MRTARHVPERGARVVSRRALRYAAGADPEIDRPAHVRAGSALVRAGRQLAVIQDDACFVAFIQPKSHVVTALQYESGAGPTRQFGDDRGNKKLKLDLEAAFVVESDRLLVALGSGSSPLRERIVVTDLDSGAEPEVIAAPAFYAMLRANAQFAGSELNLEGAVAVGGDLLLLQRGNGAPAAGLEPVDATARIDLHAFLAHVREGGELPPLRAVTRYDLGSVDGHRLTFTDGALTTRGEIAFLACAEDSPDATRDGPVAAVSLGILTGDSDSAALGLVLAENGHPLLDKAEGLAFDPDDPMRAFVVTDRDEPGAPSELLELRLGEAWA